MHDWDAIAEIQAIEVDFLVITSGLSIVINNTPTSAYQYNGIS